MNDEERRALWRDAEHDADARTRLAMIQSRLSERSKYTIPVVLHTTAKLCEFGDKGVLIDFVSCPSNDALAIILVPRLKKFVSLRFDSFEVDDSFLEG